MKVRVSPTLGGGFERTFEEAWGLETYNPLKDKDEPTVFTGCYGLPDFMAIRGHKGKKYVWWAGSDIRHLNNGYWLDEKGYIRLPSTGIAKYLNTYCENWCENKAEYKLLKYLGIEAKICPSFLGDVNKFKVTYKHSDKVKLYASVSGDDFELYGWYKIIELAKKYVDVEFHLYGNKIEFEADYPKNVIIHGRVPIEQMNEETSKMQGAIRLIEMEGFSEVICKSLLMGQYPISEIPYYGCLTVKDIDKIQHLEEPNLAGREHYIKELNNYPWTS